MALILGMLLLEHEVDGDVFELVFGWNVGFWSFMAFDVCGLRLLIMNGIVFSVVNGRNHVLKLVVWVFNFQSVRKEFFHDFRVRDLNRFKSWPGVRFLHGVRYLLNFLILSFLLKLKLIINDFQILHMNIEQLTDLYRKLFVLGEPVWGRWMFMLIIGLRLWGVMLLLVGVRILLGVVLLWLGVIGKVRVYLMNSCCILLVKTIVA